MSVSVVIPSWSSERCDKVVEESLKIQQGEVEFLPTLSHDMGCLSTMQQGAERTSANYLCFMHDDAHLRSEAWDAVLEKFFAEHPKCGLVGLGGALKFGHPWIYKIRYELPQLLRYEFRSNMKEWEKHGTRIVDAERVAFVDGFFLAFRREAFMEMGQWKRLKEYGLPEFHCYDLIACIEMIRLGWEIWVLPLLCHHEGGKTSTTPQYEAVVKHEGFRNGQELFEHAHKVAYERGRGILPYWL